MIKLSIFWDEEQLTINNSDEILKEMVSIYSTFREELTSSSSSHTGSIFIGMATEGDSELIKSLLNLPAELRSGLLDYIRTHFQTGNEVSKKETSTIDEENVLRNEKIRDLLLAFPHKDIEILIDRPLENGRDIQL